MLIVKDFDRRGIKMRSWRTRRHHCQISKSSIFSPNLPQPTLLFSFNPQSPSRSVFSAELLVLQPLQ